MYLNKVYLFLQLISLYDEQGRLLREKFDGSDVPYITYMYDSSGAVGFMLGSGGSALGSLLVRISTAAYHCDGSQDDDKRDNLFHGVKHLIVNCSVTPQS